MQLQPDAKLDPAKDPDRFKVGTLTYTKAALVTVFVWLLWGDVCVTVHSTAVHGVLNLAFKRNGAPNWLMALLLASMPSLMNFTLNPLISTASDRTRTRWGRRIPYLFLTAPIAGLIMILMGFSEDLGFSLSRATGLAQGTAIVITLAVCFGLFRITDLFVGAVYYYLFNDVVPRPFLSRFSALFGAVGQITGAFYAWYVYQYSEDHMKEILIGAGLLYLVGYTLMCVFIKEGKYPPPPEGMGRRAGLIALGKTYFKECFFHRFYWLFFLSNATGVAAGACGFAGVFLSRDSLGLNLAQLGKISAVAGIASALLLYPAGVMADRIHPLRFMRFTMVLQTIFAIVGINWLFWNPTPHTVLMLTIVFTVISLPLGVMHRAASLPMYMHMLPQERYGQFCAADAMVSALTGTIMAAIAGVFLDFMKWLYSDVFAGAFLNQIKWAYDNGDFAYRFIPVWSFAFMCLSTLTLFMLYWEWERLGGKEGYVAPSADIVHKPKEKPATEPLPVPAEEEPA